MDFDEERIDKTALAILFLGHHEGSTGEDRTWKGLDWSITDRLHEKGYISDPKSKAKSVRFTEEGLEEARKQAEKLFSKTD